MKYMVYPTMGWITNKAYIAAFIGGLGSLPGAVVGGGRWASEWRL
jgi:branched-chain amino acid transport system permease protein